MMHPFEMCHVRFGTTWPGARCGNEAHFKVKYNAHALTGGLHSTVRMAALADDADRTGGFLAHARNQVEVENVWNRWGTRACGCPPLTNAAAPGVGTERLCQRAKGYRC